MSSVEAIDSPAHWRPNCSSHLFEAAANDCSVSRLLFGRRSVESPEPWYLVIASAAVEAVAAAVVVVVVAAAANAVFVEAAVAALR